MEPIPERSNDRLGFELASIGSRLGARTVDAIIGLGVYIILFLIVVSTSDIDLEVDTEIDIPSGAALVLRWAPVLIWGLYEAFLVQSRGQTVGKMVTKIKVITVAGDDPPGWTPAALRWAVLVLPMTVIANVVGLLGSLIVGIWFVWDANRQGLHDKAANTYVVKMPAPDARGV